MFPNRICLRYMIKIFKIKSLSFSNLRKEIYTKIIQWNRKKAVDGVYVPIIKGNQVFYVHLILKAK